MKHSWPRRRTPECAGRGFHPTAGEQNSPPPACCGVRPRAVSPQVEPAPAHPVRASWRPTPSSYIPARRSRPHLVRPQGRPLWNRKRLNRPWRRQPGLSSLPPIATKPSRRLRHPRPRAEDKTAMLRLASKPPRHEALDILIDRVNDAGAPGSAPST